MNLTLGISKNNIAYTDIFLAKRGNKDAFIRLIEDNKIELIRVARGMLSNEMDIEDATQETIIMAYKCIHNLRNEQFFKTWLIKILINECNKILKKRKTLIPIEDIEVEDKLSLDVLGNITLTEAINALDKDSKIITILFYFENLSYKDISGLLNIPEGTVKSRLSRTRIKLYDLLKEEDVKNGY